MTGAPMMPESQPTGPEPDRQPAGGRLWLPAVLGVLCTLALVGLIMGVAWLKVSSLGS